MFLFCKVPWDNLGCDLVLLWVNWFEIKFMLQAPVISHDWHSSGFLLGSCCSCRTLLLGSRGKPRSMTSSLLFRNTVTYPSCRRLKKMKIWRRPDDFSLKVDISQWTPGHISRSGGGSPVSGGDGAIIKSGDSWATTEWIAGRQHLWLDNVQMSLDGCLTYKVPLAAR